jgi:hypothetical protein
LEDNRLKAGTMPSELNINKTGSFKVAFRHHGAHIEESSKGMARISWHWSIRADNDGLLGVEKPPDVQLFYYISWEL